MSIRKLTCLCIVLFLGIAVFVQTTAAQQTEEVRFSVTVWDQSLKSVLQDIEQQTGFTIILDGQIKSDPISGFYNNTTVSDFLSIALEENDISVSTDLEKKRMTISKLQTNDIAGQPQSMQEMVTFLASEADHIIKAKQSVKAPTKKERDALFNDPLTGKPWFEIEPEARLSQKQERGNNKLSEAEFLAAESEYIEHAKRAITNIQNSRSDEENIDPISGKSWDEVESQL